MNVLKIFIPLLFLFLSSCCSNVNNNDKADSQYIINKKVQSPPTTIKENQSIVTARVEEINIENENNYSINARILNVEENPAYESMAVNGSVYKLFPNYALNEKKEIDYQSYKEKNNSLQQLSKLKTGDEFKALVFMGKDNRWYIQKVLK